jgi:hypothetical protein
MPIQSLQLFHRSKTPDSAHVDTFEVDELGRMIGPYNTIEVNITVDERAVLDAIAARACAAQDQVITVAKAEVAAGRQPKRLIATPAADDRAAKEAKKIEKAAKAAEKDVTP